MKPTSKRRSNIAREYRLPANVMHEEAWEDDGPNMKLARAFIVVLVLHIVAVAALAAFNLFDSGGDKIGTGTQLPDQPATPLAGPDHAQSNQQETSPERIMMENVRPVVVEKQMSTALFALEYGLTEEQLLEANKHTPLVAGPLLPKETVYVPESAVKRATIQDLPTAPVVSPTVAADRPEVVRNETATPRAPEVAEVTPPKPKPQAQPERQSRPAAKPTTPTQTATTKPGTHILRRGENLFRISQKYGVSVQALQQANGITDPSKVFAGQVLNIPK